MPERYPRSLPDDEASSWDVAAFQPQAVLVNLGTNDFWEGDPSESYRAAMQAFVNRLSADYPAAQLYLVPSPMLWGPALDAQRAVLDSLSAPRLAVLDLGTILEEDGYGCDWHPSQATQARMGAALVAQLRKDLGY